MGVLVVALGCDEMNNDDNNCTWYDSRYIRFWSLGLLYPTSTSSPWYPNTIRSPEMIVFAA